MRNSLFTAVTVFLITLTVSLDVAIASEDKRNIRNLGEIALTSTPDESHAKRILAAKEILSLCDTIDRKLPAPSPSEKKWVEQEMAAERWDSVYGSIEVTKIRLKNFSTDCKIAANKIISLNNIGLIEVRTWINLAKVFGSEYLKGDFDKVTRRLGINFTEIERVFARSNLALGGALQAAQFALNDYAGSMK